MKVKIIFTNFFVLHQNRTPELKKYILDYTTLYKVKLSSINKKLD